MFLIVSKHDKKKAPMKGALMDEGYLVFDPCDVAPTAIFGRRSSNS